MEKITTSMEPLMDDGSFQFARTLIAVDDATQMERCVATGLNVTTCADPDAIAAANKVVFAMRQRRTDFALFLDARRKFQELFGSQFTSSVVRMPLGHAQARQN